MKVIGINRLRLKGWVIALVSISQAYCSACVWECSVTESLDPFTKTQNKSIWQTLAVMKRSKTSRVSIRKRLSEGPL